MSDAPTTAPKEGGLGAPERHPIAWRDPGFYDEQSLHDELERVYDICHGCRRCVSLCDAFPTLFDLVDESETMEMDGVDRADYMKVVDQCYLCDLCAETKCPYLPPHEFNVDFPHLMLRAKAKKFRDGASHWRDRLITSTDGLFGLIGTPGVAAAANALNGTGIFRSALEQTAGIHRDAPLPTFTSRTVKRAQAPTQNQDCEVRPGPRTTGKVALFTTCYGNCSDPEICDDFAAICHHNDAPLKLLQQDRCCGMPKLELGDLEAVERLKTANVPVLLEAIDDGYDIVAPIPSCVLMFKQELPLMFPDDPNVARIKAAFFDPFEWLHDRHRAGLLRTDFEQPLGKVAYHVACHQRVQNMGPKTRQVLGLVPGTELTAIERCSGHDGTYAMKAETYEKAMKIARPVVRKVRQTEADVYTSDCPMAGRMIEHGLDDGSTARHPLTLLRRAYGL